MTAALTDRSDEAGEKSTDETPPACECLCPGYEDVHGTVVDALAELLPQVPLIQAEDVATLVADALGVDDDLGPRPRTLFYVDLAVCTLRD